MTACHEVGSGGVASGAEDAALDQRVAAGAQCWSPGVSRDPLSQQMALGHPEERDWIKPRFQPPTEEEQVPEKLKFSQGHVRRILADPGTA